MSNEDTQSIHLLSASDYVAALDTLSDQATRSLLIFEKDFSNTGFDSPSRAEVLRSFLLSSPHNKLQLLAHDTRPLSQYYPRIMSLLRQFGHNMFVFQTPKQLRHLTEAFAIADEDHFVRRFHFDGTRGVLTHHDNSNARLLKARFNEMWQISSPSILTSSFRL